MDEKHEHEHEEENWGQENEEFIEFLRSFAGEIKIPQAVVMNPVRAKEVVGIAKKLKTIFDDECISYKVNMRQVINSLAVELFCGSYVAVTKSNLAQFAQILGEADAFEIDLSDKGGIVMEFIFPDVFVEVPE